MFICLLMAYRFICVMCFIPNYRFMFNFSKTGAHICFTKMFCQYIVFNVQYVMSRKNHCRKVLRAQRRKNLYMNIYHTSGAVIEPFQ